MPMRFSILHKSAAPGVNLMRERTCGGDDDDDDDDDDECVGGGGGDDDKRITNDQA